MPSNHLIFCCPRLLLPSIIPSIRVFSNESVLCIKWPKGCSFSFKLNEWSVLPINIQDLFPLGWTGWISLQSKGLSRVFSTPQFKSISSLALSLLYGPTLTSIHDYREINSWKATQSSILAWRNSWTTVHGVANGRTQLSDFHFTSPISVGFLVQIFAVSLWKNQGKL